MFVLNFFINTLKGVGTSVCSLCRCSPCSGRSDGAGASETQVTESLVGAEQGSNVPAGGYDSVGQPEKQQGQLGLTADYQSYWETGQAVRQLLIQLFIYLLLAVVGYSYIFEDWPIIDSIYFGVTIFTTVGYGDFSPSSDIDRIFTMCFALYGVVILGIFLGIVGQFIVDKHEENMEKRLKNARLKVLEQFSDEDHAAPATERSLLREIWDIFIAELPIFLVLVIIAAPVAYLEGWDVTMTLYWMVVTGTTIGFGDLGPTTTLTRAICIIYVPIAVAVLGEFLGRIAGAVIDRHDDEVEDRFMNRCLTLGDIEKMDTSDDGRVSPDEFLTHMLVAMQKVEKEEIEEILELFQKLDKDKTGYIDKDDLSANYHLNVRPGVVARSESSKL